MVVAYNGSREFMQEVVSLIGNFLVNLGFLYVGAGSKQVIDA